MIGLPCISLGITHRNTSTVSSLSIRGLVVVEVDPVLADQRSASTITAMANGVRMTANQQASNSSNSSDKNLCMMACVITFRMGIDTPINGLGGDKCCGLGLFCCFCTLVLCAVCRNNSEQARTLCLAWASQQVSVYITDSHFIRHTGN